MLSLSLARSLSLPLSKSIALSLYNFTSDNERVLCGFNESFGLIVIIMFILIIVCVSTPKTFFNFC